MIDKVSLKNFKGTTDVANLAQLNIFRGSSGSGKSTWLEGIRVAVLGHDPEYGKLLAETMSLSSGDTMEVKVSNKDVQVERVFSKDRSGKATHRIFINGDSMTAKAAEPLLAEQFGQFPMMLNPDEFFDMSDDKKITFLFGLSNEESDSKALRRKCLVETLNKYTEAVGYLLEYEFKDSDYSSLEDGSFIRLLSLTIDKIAEKDVPAGRALTKVFSEFFAEVLPNGQETLSMYTSKLRNELNAVRRAKQDAEAANRKLIQEKSEKMKLVNYNEEENRTEVERLRFEISEIDKELHTRERLSSAKERLLSGLGIHEAAVVAAAVKITELEKNIPSEADKKEAVKILHDCEIETCRLAEKVFKAEVKRLKLEKDYVKIIAAHKAATQTNKCKTCGSKICCPECGTLTEEGKHKYAKEVKETSKKVQEIYNHVEAVLETYDSNDKDQENVNEVIRSHSLAVEFHEIAVQRHADLAKLVIEEKGNLDKIEEPGAGTEILKTSLQSLKGSLAERLVAEKNHQWLRTLEATISSANETIYNSDAQIEALISSGKSVKSVRDELTKSSIGWVEVACNSLLEKVDPKFRMSYEIFDGKFDIWCVNVSGESVPFKTLSGGEKVLYLSAQLLALMKIVDPKLKVLAVEMGELSGDLVPPFMGALKSMTEGLDIQIVLSSCHTDFEVTDDAWKVHQMGE